MSKYGVFSGPYFPVFCPNAGKYEPKKTPYLDTFYAVFVFINFLDILHQLKKNDEKNIFDTEPNFAWNAISLFKARLDHPERVEIYLYLHHNKPGIWVSLIQLILKLQMKVRKQKTWPEKLLF